mmetsp:Transcript_8107/g.9293  ORF Transcript_8107/g.9293 Transcript_8107/m.9293 type:complete len:301 (-) Transcript_8107:1903-2805(-)
MNFLGLGNNAVVQFKLRTKKGRPTKQVVLNSSKGLVKDLCIFQGNEPIAGVIDITPKKRKLEHIGIKIELIGQIEQLHDRGNPYEFTSLVRELAPPGVVTEKTSFPFTFEDVDKEHESYKGISVQLRYFLRLTISSQYGVNTITKEEEFWIQNLNPSLALNHSIKMEVGIEECLHIEFEYDKSKYHLKDVVIGKVYFLLVRIKIKSMELAIVKRETVGSGANMVNNSETLVKFEIMDGAPVRGESIPVRLFLSNSKLTPTYSNVNNQFSVKYYLNLVLLDETDRRYFKQQEIQLFRDAIG